MNKEEFIAKRGEAAYRKALERVKNAEKKRKESVLRYENGIPYLCFDFTTALPERENLAISAYDDYLLERGTELSQHFRRVIRNKWLREMKEKGDCIVVIEPKINKVKKVYRFRLELYSRGIDEESKQWLIETIKNLDYE